jgi:crotonobetaine/carnitine-CoA ligase
MKKLRDTGLIAEDLTPQHLLERQARRNGDRIWVRVGDKSISYGDLDRQTDRLANGFFAAGIQTGDHVAVMLDNGEEILLTQFALGKIGAVICPINTGAKGELLTYYLTQSNASAIILGTLTLPRFAAIATRTPKVRRVITVQELEPAASMPATLPIEMEVIPYESLCQGADRRPNTAVSHKDTAGIFYTSGTTGPSKGIIASHAQSLTFALGRVEYFGYQPDDVIYTCLPLFHASAMYHAAIAALLADAQVVVAKRFSASGFWHDIRRVGATQFNLLGSMVNILWGRPPSNDDRTHRVRLCGMAPIPPFAQAFEQRFGIPVVTSYGLTDFGQGTILQPDYPSEKFRSVGKPRPGVEVQVQDDVGTPLSSGHTGEICLRSDDLSLGGRRYYCMDEANARAWRKGWFLTGDRGWFDAEGYLYFTDRKKDAIRRRGENISAWEVEQAIAMHPDVLDVAVVGVYDDMQDEEVLACVILDSDSRLDEKELVLWCAEQLPRWMVPRFIEFCASLPRTLTEKIEKRSLRAEAQKRLANLWDRERAGVVLPR